MIRDTPATFSPFSPNFAGMAGGRPRIWADPEEMEQACEDYFNQVGKPTVTGLALFLTFADKTTLYDYRDRPEFSHSIKRALTRIEKYHEEGLSENNVAGRIFALKNMGWKDTTGHEHTGPNGEPLLPPAITINVVKPVEVKDETKD